MRTSNFTGLLNPYQNQWVPGVLQWGQDASLFKVVYINEHTFLRINADFLNVFNTRATPTASGETGLESTRSSGNSPRTLQLSLRLTF